MNLNKNKNSMKQLIPQSVSRLRLSALLGALIIAGSGLALSRIAQAKEETKSPPVRLNVNENSIARDGKISASFSPVVKKVAPSVVKIFTTTKIKQPELGRSPLMNDPFFRRFFGEDPEEPSTGRRPNRVQRQYGLGSGVVVTKDGYILTNNHVVDKADEIKAMLNDGREFTAKVVGKDSKSEIAVLKIEASDLPFVTLANSDKVEVGDLVLALGNPFGVGQTVTMGMVSATSRMARDIDLDYQDFIQTDAAINPGNSGGALIDAEGRLIGINTFIVSRSGGNEGIGFAVPVNLARNVMESLVEHGRVIRGFIGVMIQDVDPKLAKEFGLEEANGALVAEVTPKSPAEKAGIKSGDVVTEFDGKPVKDSRHLKLQVGQTAPNERVSVKLLRDGKTKTVELTLKELEAGEKTAKADRRPQGSNDALDGVTVGDMDAAARSQFRLPRDVRGALVSEVDEDSAAFEAGLRPGDVIQEINRKPVRDAAEAVEMTENMTEKTILLRIWSRGGSRYLVVDESKKR